MCQAVASWWLLSLLPASVCDGAASSGRDRERDPFAAVERDIWDRDRERDLLYGSSGYRDRDYGIYGGSYRDYYGSAYRDTYGGGRDFASERKDPSTEDECSRVEASGVPLADALRETAALLGNSSGSVQVAPEWHHLLAFFAGERHRRFLLAHCPQAVVLAALLQAELGAAGATLGAEAAEDLSELLASAPALRAPYRAPPQWTGAPWEPLLHAAQQRTGVVLFPISEQQFQVEYVSAANWSIHPRRRCAGRRDLGNLQATPLATCLAKCTAHPLCKSATFWHWQPGGFGFEQRCFLSSSCTATLATAEGADGAVLFEKRGGQSPREAALMRRTVVVPGGAPWAPRCGHRLLATPAGDGVQLWLLGGVGVDPFSNASTGRNAQGDEGAGWSGGYAGVDSGDPGARGGARVGARGASGTDTDDGKTGSRAWSRKNKQSNSSASSVVEAYLSRHVELNGELPPLRSLPYGRLADVWRSDDLGSTWNLITSEAPWGRRAFFGAVPVLEGQALLVFGGVQEPMLADVEANGGASSPTSAALAREYMNDVWCAQLTAGSATWKQLAQAPWTPRAAFQALSRAHTAASEPGRENDEVLILGGRLADGTLVSDVWAATVRAHALPIVIEWRQLTARAPWAPRTDFAASAASTASDIWILGGCDQAGRALMDVWWSSDGQGWRELLRRAPWGPRVGAAAVTLGMPGSPIMLFGGFAYPDSAFGPVHADAFEDAPLWASATWVSRDGVQWQPLNVTRMSWAPNAMHAALVSAPCGGNRSGACAYAAGGLTHEGYYDNSVHRLLVSGSSVATLQAQRAGAVGAEVPARLFTALPRDVSLVACVGFVVLGTVVVIALRPRYVPVHRSGIAASGAQEQSAPLTPLDPRIRCALGVLAFVCIFGMVLAAYLLMAFAHLSRELRQLQTESPKCRVDGESTDILLEKLGLRRLTEQRDQFETLLRLASREPQFSYSSFGGYHDYWRGSGRAGDGYGAGASRGFDRGYGLDGGYYGGYGSYGYGSYGEDAAVLEAEAGSRVSAAARERELALLPTTQGLSCRSPRCDRNATTCAAAAGRSLTTPFGCCSDYMLLMLGDVTEWLVQQNIPYFITYGTLLGALRDGEILPYTQDMDIVVDRTHWPQLQRGLEAAEFFGGRRYLFGVDQWEERVSRICADWEGFAASTIGGPDGDRLSRGTEFHLDVYASDWWQITDLHLIDCIEPLGSAVVPIHGRNFSAPARPRACIEKLYGVDWRTPKHALSGVN
uniref:LicD/FKTN/FKRP nucleotidyltransferase domain-containing protein n=1 Tax=Pyrodinium bahamense TaxID=73915 RepID=A0A7S0A4F6_9DINO|mmetsp:Transcript_21998/g.60871  ORF Transcript_21998/g.60871 Transcript_21998/m.60871 type:complete len:1250 (+) Transcript_21998:104-3853(+)